MGIKQDIVVVSEFSMPLPGGGGSRGATPGDYVWRYMARDRATETLTPVRREDPERFIERYMLREDAVEAWREAPDWDVKQELGRIQGQGGVAFGYDADEGFDISMSHSRVRRESKRIQKAFDEGKTVIKTVVSFDEEYLRRTGIIDEDFRCLSRGDYRGNIDQMRLRDAIREGMERLSSRFDRLAWVGVIQVDTGHVHCHLAMVDEGPGRMASNGTQRGKLSEADKRLLRRGMDAQLDRTRAMRMMASNVDHDRRNVRALMRRRAHELMVSHGVPQYLMSCLPEDTRLWRASSRADGMAQANAIVREFVEAVLARPGSGYASAMADVGAYARERAEREGLGAAEERRLLEAGRERIVEGAMNAVYAMLKEIPEERRREVRTPMLEMMSLDWSEMASAATGDEMVEFGFKLRTFGSRLRHHRSQRGVWHERARALEEAAASGGDESRGAMLEMARTEELYHAMLAAKYAHFLSFLPPDSDFEDELQELGEMAERHARLEGALRDATFRRLGSAEACEEWGREAWGLSGMGHLFDSRGYVESRAERELAAYEAAFGDLRARMASAGLVLSEDLGVSAGAEYAFDDVKAIDLHHLGYDFPFSAEVSKANVEAFSEFSRRRYDAMMAAADYLVRSGQAEAAAAMDMEDAARAVRLADRLSERAVLESARERFSGTSHDGRTFRLDEDYNRDMELAVEASVASFEGGGSL